MPQTKSRVKDLRQAHKRTYRNRRLKEQVKATTKAVLAAAQSGNEQQIGEALGRAYKAIDKAAKVGALPAPRGDRKKSVLARRIAAAQTAAQQ